MPPNDRCLATVYSRSPNGDSHRCKHPATAEGLCYAHQPATIQAREDLALQQAAERIERAGLQRRKLLLIPVLDEAEKARKRIKNEQGALGALIVVNILRQAIREAK